MHTSCLLFCFFFEYKENNKIGISFDLSFLFIEKPRPDLDDVMRKIIDGNKIADLISPFLDSPTSDAPNATLSPDPFSHPDDR